MKYRFRGILVKDGKEVEIPDTATHIGVYELDGMSIVSWLETLKVEPEGEVEGAECDRCGKEISGEDGEGKVYCENCFDRMQTVIEEQREMIDKLETENGALDESISAATQIIEKLQRGEASGLSYSQIVEGIVKERDELKQRLEVVDRVMVRIESWYDRSVQRKQESEPGSRKNIVSEVEEVTLGAVIRIFSEELER